MSEQTSGGPRRILSGIQPSGTLHLGNYFGMMKPAIELQETHECFYFIADYHALTQLPEPALLRARVREVALDFLACGLDPARVAVFRQSDVPQVQELTWVLSCLAPVGLLERCHSYKDKLAKGFAPNHGLFSYPVLMAADILLYQAWGVPVGKDQKQHLEVARDLAVRFNNQYGKLLAVPEPLIREEVAVIPGLDGQKMSKSYHNTIEIFGEEKALRKKFMSIKTDSTPVEAPKNPDTCNLFALYKLMAAAPEVAELRQRYLAGGLGYGQVKQMLFEKCWGYFAEARARRAELLAQPERIAAALAAGAERARAVAARTLAQVYDAVGLR
ncbi:MAG: tryptophan--tRNA ligase [Lentisphaeria bacterium]|jgi:tryptophanyl-tRNA synthetase